MIIKRARCKGSFREQCWYDRGKRFRHYQLFSLVRTVSSVDGSFWRMVVGPWVICWGYKERGK